MKKTLQAYLTLNKSSGVSLIQKCVKRKVDINEVPMLNKFMTSSQLAEEIPVNIFSSFVIRSLLKQNDIDSIEKNPALAGKKFYVETYGCQMNVSDTEIVNSILLKSGLEHTDQFEESDVVFLNTCAIREGAESKIWRRLEEIKAYKRKNKDKKEMVTGILGIDIF